MQEKKMGGTYAKKRTLAIRKSFSYKEVLGKVE